MGEVAEDQEDGQEPDTSSRQKAETQKALSEMNELWCLKLQDLIEQYDDIIEEQYKQRIKKPTKEDQIVIRKLVAQNPEYK